MVATLVRTGSVTRVIAACAVVAYVAAATTPAFAAQEQNTDRPSLLASAAVVAAQTSIAPWETECARRLAAARSRRATGVGLTEVGLATAATGLVVVRFWGDTAGWGGFVTAILGGNIAGAGSRLTGRANEEVTILASLPGCSTEADDLSAVTRTAGEATDAVTVWQMEVKAAKARRSAGRKEERIGLVVLAASQVVALSAPRDCDSYVRSSSASPGSHKSCNGRAATALSLIGAGITTTVLGHNKASGADRDLATLLARGVRPGGLTVAVPAHASQTVGLTLGPTVRQVTWRIRW